jgi:hypothetical protein
MIRSPLQLDHSRHAKLTEGIPKDSREQQTILKEPRTEIKLVMGELGPATIQGIVLLGLRVLLAQLPIKAASIWLLRQLPLGLKEAEYNTQTCARCQDMQVTIGVIALRTPTTLSAMNAEVQVLVEADIFLSLAVGLEENLPLPSPEELVISMA